MKFLLLLLAACIPTIIFYFLDKIFNLKVKLIKLFKSIDAYTTAMLVVYKISYILFAIFLSLTDNTHLIALLSSPIFLYHYLIHIPQELR